MSEPREAVRDAIYEALGGALDCTRCWSAWSARTMTEDDFDEVREDDGRLDEITDAALGAIKHDDPGRIKRLQDAVEGECEGLAITDDQAREILFFVDTGAGPAPEHIDREESEFWPGFTVTCNACNSANVHLDNSMGFSETSGSWGSIDFKCQDCGASTEIAR